MSTIKVSSQDVTAAENLLEEYLTDAVPDGDFTKGTALRDLTVGALAAVYAFLKQEANTIKGLQSLKSIEESIDDSDPETIDDAATALLSNWFITRKSGSLSRGVLVGHLSQAVDIFIRPTVRFFKTAQLIFKLDNVDTLFIAKETLTPVINADGTITEYQFTFPVVAVAKGTSYDISPGVFTGFDNFNPFVTRVENTQTFTGGADIETTEEILKRAPTAISVRNLINSKSISAVLEETFPEIERLYVVGYGDPEMQRDALTGVAASLAIHVGGCVDIYAKAGTTETSFTGTIGGSFARPDNICNIFKDATSTATTKFTATPAVQVGDIIKVTAGLPAVPREYKVTAVRDTEIEISERVPFPKATDEELLVGDQFVSYTVGRVAPTYSDIRSTGGLPITTGQTSRHTSTSGRITLPGSPVFLIKDVAITNPSLSDPFIDPTDGLIHFTQRLNTAPTDVTDPSENLQYQVVVHNPLEAQSANQRMEINVGPSSNLTRWDGKSLKVTYTTLSNFATVNSFIQNRFERVVSASQLLRGYHPVKLTASIRYKLSSDTTESLDDDAVAESVVSFINGFDTTTKNIDVSSIMEYMRANYATIAAVYPFSINYLLTAPTGDILTYSTNDEVAIDELKKTDGPDLDLTSLGISGRTVQYFTSTDDILISKL